jgi:hypothetical protein
VGAARRQQLLHRRAAAGFAVPGVRVGFHAITSFVLSSAKDVRRGLEVATESPLRCRVGEAVRRVNARSAGTTTLRSYDQVARFFDGLQLIEPGLVQVQRWRPGAAAADEGEEMAAYAGLARKS